MDSLEWIRIDSDNLKGKLWVYGNGSREIYTIYCARDQPTIISELNGIIEDVLLDRMIHELNSPDRGYIKIFVNGAKKDSVKLNKRLFLDSDADILECKGSVTPTSLEKITEEEIGRYFISFFNQDSKRHLTALSKQQYSSENFMNEFYIPFRRALETGSAAELHESAASLLSYAENKGKRFREDIGEMLALTGRASIGKGERLSVADLYVGKIDSYMHERFGNAAALKMLIDDWKIRNGLDI